jgi:hypothetical protein
MANRLLDRQVSLLKYLTSSAAIFGGREDALLDRGLQGMDRRLLRLEARFSHQKRLEKIVAVFPKTFKILGAARTAIVKEFTETCPPTDIGRLENATQFYDFLRAGAWRGSKRAYLPDVAACELACAKIRVAVDQQDAIEGGIKPPSGRHIRCSAAVALLRCAYDIRPIFERDAGRTAPKKRDTALVIAMPPGAREPAIFEVLPVAFDLLSALDHWTDPAALGATSELEALVAELREHGLLEVNECESAS